MIAELADRGYRLMYNATGPKVLHMLLSDGQLHRLYLTSVPRLLGGEPYSSIVEGGLLTPPANFALRSLYLDTAAGAGEGQLFSAYDLAT